MKPVARVLNIFKSYKLYFALCSLPKELKTIFFFLETKSHLTHSGFSIKPVMENYFRTQNPGLPGAQCTSPPGETAAGSAHAPAFSN